jgi:hypothetical protein
LARTDSIFQGFLSVTLEKPRISRSEMLGQVLVCTGPE